MISEQCSFETERLSVAGWHDVSLPEGVGLSDVVVEVLTPAVTATLPPSWRGEYTHERASAWIAERDAESTVLLAARSETGDPVGLVILAEEPPGEGAGFVNLRLGYVLAQSAWGQGLASEIVGGLVEWCQRQPGIGSMAGGVALGNEASTRVLTKHAFVPVATQPEAGERIYQLVFQR